MGEIENKNPGVQSADESKIRKLSWLVWGIPIIFVLLLFFFIPQIQNKLIKNNAGKPVFVTSQNYGRVENIFIKKGDAVEPGKELCSFIATDRDGSIPASTNEVSAVEVTVKHLEGKLFEDVVELPGVVAPYMEANISAQVSGKIIEFSVKEGQNVKKGDIIAKIDKRDYQIALDRDRAEFEFAKNEFQRSEQLLKGNAVNLSSHESKKNDYDIKRTTLENAQLLLERCDIKAPFDGIVDKKFSEEGEIAAPGEKIAKIIDITKVKVNVGIPEKDIAHVRKIKEITFISPSLENKEFKGTFTNLVISMIDTAKVYPLIVEANNPSRELLPGMIVKAKIIRGRYENAILLPIFSVIPGDDEYYTFVENNLKAEKRVLKIGSFQDKNVHIIEGLKPGDRLIDKGHKLVADGASVKVIN